MNGTTAALLDTDPADPADVTFWNTRWRPEDPYPHALAFDTAGFDQVCGIQWTSRPSYKTVYGNQDTPSSYKIYALDESVDFTTAWEESWKAGVTQENFQAEHLVKTGGLAATNDAQAITFAPVTAKQLVLAGLASQANKAAMSAADIKVIPCAAPAQPETGSGVDTLVHDVYLNREPFSERDNYRNIVRFDPSNHTYYSTVFTYTDSVLPTVKTVPGATATINGNPVSASGDLQVSLHEGWNPITIAVNGNGQEATYVINVRKDSAHDFRGREVVSGIEVATNDSSDGSVMFDGDESTGWQPDNNYNETEEWQADSTGFTLTFSDGKAHNVSKITATASFTSNTSWDAGRAFKIVGSSDGTNFDTVLATKATLRNDTLSNFVYWDFNQSAPVKAIRIWMTPLVNAEGSAKGTNVRFNEMKVWQNANNAEEVLPEQPTGDTTSQMYDPTADSQAWGISRAQTLFMKYGIIAPTWVPSEYYGRGSFDAYEQSIAGGGVIPMFYDRPLFDKNLMARIPDSYWSIAKAPAGGNSMGEHTTPEPFLTDEMKAYAKNLINIQYGDEGHWSTEERNKFKSWFDFSKKTYPGAIVHNNQNPGAWTNLSVMRNYARYAQPDVITWDSYEFSYGALSGNQSPDSYVRTLMNRTMNVYRQVAMEGYDGEGASPIPWGQYIDYSFNRNFSPSQKNLTAMMSLTAGAKWLGNFRMEYTSYDRSAITDANGSPTRAWYEYKDTFDAQKNLGNYLTALNHNYMATVPGDYGNGENTAYTGYRAGKFGDAKVQNATRDWGLVNVSATSNPDGVNAGRAGDVVIGYFSKLPTLVDSKTAEIFNGATNPKAFMVLNALAGQTTSPSKGLASRYDTGAAWQTRQDITVTVKAPAEGQQLYRVDHTTGKATPVELLPGSDETTRQFQVSLDGGMADLFFWTAPNQNDEVTIPRDPNGVAYHPASIKADSEQNSNREVARVGNLIDNSASDPSEPELATFWHSEWHPQNAPMPHSLVFPKSAGDTRDVKQVCGVRLSPRDNSPQDMPKTVTVYSFDKEPSGFATLTDSTKAWDGGTPVAEAVTTRGQAATILFDNPVTADYLGVAIWDTHANKPFTSLSDLSLLDCTPAMTVAHEKVAIPASGEDVSNSASIYHAKPGQTLHVRVVQGDTVIESLTSTVTADEKGNATVTFDSLKDLEPGEYTVELRNSPEANAVLLASDTFTVTKEAPAPPTEPVTPPASQAGNVYLRRSVTTGVADTAFQYGRSGDEIFFGDWNGDGIKTVGLRRGNTFYLKNTNTPGSADIAFTYGRAGDQLVIGDWNGDGIDTIGVYRNRTFYLSNTLTNTVADLTFVYGRDGDTPVAGDWNGDGTDTVGVQRGRLYYLSDTNTAGHADHTFAFGRPGDTPVVGDADGNGTDTVSVRRGREFFVKNTLADGPADTVAAYGTPSDTGAIVAWLTPNTPGLAVTR